MVRTVAVGVMACALAACGPSAGTTATTLDQHNDPDAPKRAPYIVSESPGIATTATDAHYLYWIDDAGLKRRPHGDAEAQAEIVTGKLTSDTGVLLVMNDKAYLFGDATVVSVKIDVKGAEPETIATLAANIDALTVSTDNEIYLATGGQIVQVEPGKEPRVLASGLGTIHDVIADDSFIYFGVDDGPAASAPPPPPSPYWQPPAAPATPRGSLRKVPQAGGKVIDLATDQAVPGALALYDGRLYWVSPGGPAVSSVPIGGGDVRVEAPGHAETLAVDAGGVVYRQGNELGIGVMIVENRAGARQVAFVPDGTWTIDYTAGALALSPDWIYLTATRYMTGATGILALPRQIQAIQIPFAIDRVLNRLDVEDDTLYWYETTRDYDGHNHIMRGDPMTGEHRELADFEGSITELVAGGGQVYFHDGYTISQVAVGGGEIRTFDRVDSWVTGLHVHRNHVYWFDGSSIYARKRRGGASFQIARNDQYYGYGYGYDNSGGDMVFDDDYLYTTGFGQGGTGVFQISERGRIKPLWGGDGASYPGSDLVLLGDELFFLTGLGSGSITVMKTTTDGDASPLYHGRGDGYGVDLVQGGGMLYLQQNTGEYYELTRIDPSTGEAQTVFRIYPNGDYPTMDADDRAVYFGMNGYEAIFRIPHDAPAVPDVGWAPVAE